MKCDGGGKIIIRTIPERRDWVNCPGCPACQPCEECGGDGFKVEIQHLTDGVGATPYDCPTCQGTGRKP